jgi:uncharacterized membrane protein YvbJ
MAIIACWECGKEISDSAQACPHCGAPKKEALKQETQEVAAAPVEPEVPQKSGLGFFSWFFIIVIGLFVIFMAIGAASSNSSNSASYDKLQRAEAMCEKMIADSALGDERRNIRANCDALMSRIRSER